MTTLEEYEPQDDVVPFELRIKQGDEVFTSGVIAFARELWNDVDSDERAGIMASAALTRLSPLPELDLVEPR